MIDCPINPIDFDLFWKISSVVLAPSALNLYKDLPVRFEEYKQKIRQSAGSDPDTGIPFLLPERTRRLLDYDLPVRLTWLLRCLVASIFSVITYVVCDKIPCPFDTGWYNCLISTCTYIGIFPVFVSIWIGVSVLAQLIRLYRESTRNPR